jgi:hypothetical protein
MEITRQYVYALAVKVSNFKHRNVTQTIGIMPDQSVFVASGLVVLFPPRCQYLDRIRLQLMNDSDQPLSGMLLVHKGDPVYTRVSYPAPIVPGVPYERQIRVRVSLDPETDLQKSRPIVQVWIFGEAHMRT